MSGRAVADVGQDDDFAAEFFNQWCFGEALTGVVAAFGVDIGANLADEFARREIAKRNNIVYAAERGENGESVAEGVDGSSRAFKLANAFVAVDSNNKNVAERSRLF